jgi:NAD(P)-dependent dehydrogenase (short-subunit alcohol dehydrogenase family)
LKIFAADESNGSLSESDVIVSAFDLGDITCHAEKVTQNFEQFGSIDILFANSARLRLNLFSELDNADWNFVYQNNLIAPLNLIRLVVEQWRRQDRPGRIMFTSSVTASAVVPLYACYASAKLAMQVSTSLFPESPMDRCNCFHFSSARFGSHQP